MLSHWQGTLVLLHLASHPPRPHFSQSLPVGWPRLFFTWQDLQEAKMETVRSRRARFESYTESLPLPCTGQSKPWPTRFKEKQIVCWWRSHTHAQEWEELWAATLAVNLADYEEHRWDSERSVRMPLCSSLGYGFITHTDTGAGP